MPEQYSRKPNTICLVCSKPIYRRPIELQKSDGRAFCSSVCYGKQCRKEQPCIVCGVAIMAHEHKKTCSRACANKNRAGIKYNTGRLHDNVKDQRAIKAQLIKERGAQCERCDYSVVQILQVHHKDRDPQNNVLKNVELLCPNCHATEHYFKKSWLNDRVTSD